MPFLVDSLTMELTRQQRDVHVVIHPQFDVVRDITGALQEVAAGRGRLDRGDRRTRSASRGCTSRSPGSREDDDAGAIEESLPTVLRDVREAVEDWHEDARPGARRSSTSSTGRRRRRCPSEEIAQGSELLRWLADDHFTFLGYREYRLEREDDDEMLRARARHRARHPARRPGHVGVVRQAAAAGRAEGAREDPAGAGQGQLAGDGAPPGLPRLRRRQDVRRERRGGRRAPVPRPVLQRGLHRVADPDPAAAREGRRGARPDRVRPAQPRRQGADGHARDLPARRAVPHPGRRAGADRRGGHARAGAPAAAAVHPPRHLRPLRLRAGLPAARPLQHHRPRAVLRDPQGAPRRRVRRVHRPGHRVDDGQRALRGPPAAGRGDRRRRHAPTSSAGSPRRPARGATTSSPPSSASTARSRARAWPASTSTRSRRPTRRTSSPRTGAVDLGRLEALAAAPTTRASTCPSTRSWTPGAARPG